MKRKMKSKFESVFAWFAGAAAVTLFCLVSVAAVWFIVILIGGVVDRFAENNQYNSVYDECLRDAAFQYCEENECGVIGVGPGDFLSAPQFSARFDERRGDTSIIRFTYQEILNCTNRAEVSIVEG